MALRSNLREARRRVKLSSQSTTSQSLALIASGHQLTDNQRLRIKQAIQPAFNSKDTPTLRKIEEYLSPLIGNMLHDLKNLTDRLVLVIRQGAELIRFEFSFNFFQKLVTES